MRYFFKILLISCFLGSGCQIQTALFQRFKAGAANIVSSGVSQLPVLGKYIGQMLVVQTIVQGLNEGLLRLAGPQKIEIRTATTWKEAIWNWITNNSIPVAYQMASNIKVAHDHAKYINHLGDDLQWRRCYMTVEPEKYSRIVTGTDGRGTADPRFVEPSADDFGVDRGRRLSRFVEETGADAIMYGISKLGRLDDLNRMIDSSVPHPLARFGLKVAVATGTALVREGIQKFALHPAIEFGKHARNHGLKGAIRAMAVS